MRCYTVTYGGAKPGINVDGCAIILGWQLRLYRKKTKVRVPLDPASEFNTNVDGRTCVLSTPGEGALLRIWCLGGKGGQLNVHPAASDPNIPADESVAMKPLAVGFDDDGHADALFQLHSNTGLQLHRTGSLPGTPERIRVWCQHETVHWLNLDEHAQQVAAEVSIAEACAAVPDSTAALLEWKPTPSPCRRTHPPVLVSGAVHHVFTGRSIPKVMTVIRDVSVRNGALWDRTERFEVVLAPGVMVLPGEPEVRTRRFVLE